MSKLWLQPLLPLGRGALQRLVDRAAEHELAAEDLHRLAIAVRITGSPSRPTARPSAARQPRCRSLRLVEHLAGQHQREGRGVDEGRVGFAELLGPVEPGQLVVDQRVGGLGVGHAQQRFGEAHQRDALLAAEVIGLEESVEPRRLVAAHRLDQRPRNRRASPAWRTSSAASFSRCEALFVLGVGGAAVAPHPAHQHGAGPVHRRGPLRRFQPGLHPPRSTAAASASSAPCSTTRSSGCATRSTS